MKINFGFLHSHRVCGCGHTENGCGIPASGCHWSHGKSVYNSRRQKFLLLFFFLIYLFVLFLSSFLLWLHNHYLWPIMTVSVCSSVFYKDFGRNTHLFPCTIPFHRAPQSHFLSVRFWFSQDMLNCINGILDFLNSVISGKRLWVYKYNLKPRCAASQPEFFIPRLEKETMQGSNSIKVCKLLLLLPWNGA